MVYNRTSIGKVPFAFGQAYFFHRFYCECNENNSMVTPELVTIEALLHPWQLRKLYYEKKISTHTIAPIAA
jgi:hypothetical protein